MRRSGAGRSSPTTRTTFIAKDPEHYHQVAGGGFGVDVLYLNNETKPFNDVAFRTGAEHGRRPRGHLGDRRLRRLARDHERDRAAAAVGRRVHLRRVPGPGARGRRRRRQARCSTDAGYTWDGRRAHRPRRRAGHLHAHEPERLDRLPRRARHHRRGRGRPRRRGDGRADRARTRGSTTPSRSATSRRRCTGPTAAARRGTCTRTSWTARPTCRSARRRTGTSAATRTTRSPRRSPTSRPATTTRTARRRSTSSQQRFVEDVPGIIIWSRPAVAQYSTVNYTGFPTAEDPYANPQPTGPQAALILSKLTPTE